LTLAMAFLAGRSLRRGLGLSVLGGLCLPAILRLSISDPIVHLAPATGAMQPHLTRSARPCQQPGRRRFYL
jgi:hypothetical protein